MWYSNTNIRGAQQRRYGIGPALRRCDWLVVVLTPDAVESRWVKRELLFALQQDRFNGRIAPILCRSCNHDELSWTLASLQMVGREAVQPHAPYQRPIANQAGVNWGANWGANQNWPKILN